MEMYIRVQKALDYIEQHITESINNDQLAEISGLPTNQLYCYFMILVGCTPEEYIQNRKLSLAGIDLVTGNENICNIVSKYGYQCLNNFSRAFQQFHGVSPQQAQVRGTTLKYYSRFSIHISLDLKDSIDA